MNIIQKRLLSTPKNIEKSSFIWNLLGSLTYAVMSVLLLMIVTNILGADIAGVFSIAFTTSQLLLTIGLFEIRSFQITEQKNKYCFFDYLYARAFTTAVMIVIGILYAILGGHTFEKCLLILLLCLYRVPETMGDVLEGYYQQKNELYIGGRIFTFRTLLSSLVFIGVLMITKDILTSCICFMGSAFLLFFILQGGLYKRAADKKKIDYKKLGGILLECMPLFVGNFLLTYILNAPKYAIDGNLSSKMQAYFNVILMPAYTINLMSSFIFKPYLVGMSKIWSEGKKKELKKIILKVMLCVLGITIVTMTAGYFLGLPILKGLYGLPEIMNYRREFELILLGGGFNAAGVFLYFILTIMRKQKWIIAGYGVTFFISVFLSGWMVKEFGIMGAAFNYMMNLLLLFLFFLGFVVAGMKEKRGKVV